MEEQVCRGRLRVFGFVNFKIFIRYLIGNIKQVIGYMSLDFSREDGIVVKNLGNVIIQTVFKVIDLDQIFKEVSICREKKWF